MSRESPGAQEESEQTGIRFTDKRRIDPQTHEVRQPASADPARPAGGPAGIGDDAVLDGAVADAEIKLAELTDDLQRVHAEYANYRRRVDRDRELVRESAVGATLLELLPVIDDVERARQHGELDGAFKAVGEALEAALAKLGLERFGADGETFDPTVHEALAIQERDDVHEPTVVAVYQPGYRYAGRILRPARVAVAGT